MKFNKKKYDIIFYASNVAGLGSSNVVSCLLESLSVNEKLHNKKIKVYLPKIDYWKNISVFNSNWEIVFIKRYKFKLTQLLFRFFEIFIIKFFLPESDNLVILGDFPMRISSNQVVLLHNPHIVKNTNRLNIFTFHRFVFKLNHRFVNNCVVQTDLMKEKLINSHPFFINKVTSLLMPINRIFDKPEQFVFDNNRIDLFYPASYYRHKNHILILKILNSPNFHKINNVAFHLTISNKNWNQITNIRDFNLTSINLLGTINQKSVKEYYTKTGVLFFPSIDETYGLPLVEAMKMGAFIVCSNLPYARELCGEEAIYFNPNDANSAIDAILILKHKVKNKDFPNWDDALAKFPNNWHDYGNKFIQFLI